MQNNTSDFLDLDERQKYIAPYDSPPTPDGGMWNQLHEQANIWQQL